MLELQYTRQEPDNFFRTMKFLTFLICFIRIFNLTFAKNLADVSNFKLTEEEAKAIDTQVERRHFFKNSHGNIQENQYTQQQPQKQQQQPQMLVNEFNTLATKLVTLSQDQISIFAFYLRDNYDFIHSNAKLFKDLLIFVPTDAAIKRISAKPWEFPCKIDSSMSEKEADETSKDNILNFIKSHLINVTDSNFKLPDSDNLILESVNGNELEIKNEQGEFVVGTKGLGQWFKISNTVDDKVGEQTITLIIIDGSLDWPGKQN